MKYYYIKYPRNFANEYSLFSVNHGSTEEKYLIEHNFERLTRKEAERLCAREKERRTYDPTFSGHAPITIEEFTPNIRQYYQSLKY